MLKEGDNLNTNKYKKTAIDKFGNIIKITSTNEIVFTCPKCNRNKLYVNPSNGLFYCFRCGYTGKLKIRSSLSSLKENNIEKLKEISQFNNESNDIILIPFYSKPLTEEQKQALKNRGITDSDITFYNICGREQDNRIQIPNYVKGIFTDITCNWEYDKSKINDDNPKYIMNEGVKKNRTLFNLHNVPENIDSIILCEGIFNAITAGRNAVASFGCNLSDRQCDLILSKKPKKIVIAYDSDEPGVLGSIEAIKKFKNKNYKGKLEYILLPKGVDINDLGQENFLQYYENNKMVIDLSSNLGLILPKLLFESMK